MRKIERVRDIDIYRRGGERARGGGLEIYSRGYDEREC